MVEEAAVGREPFIGEEVKVLVICLLLVAWQCLLGLPALFQRLDSRRFAVIHIVALPLPKSHRLWLRRIPSIIYRRLRRLGVRKSAPNKYDNLLSQT
jgi:hypothetical protein